MALDPALKESILGDLRLANALIAAKRPDLGLSMLVIAIRRTKEASA